MNITATDFVQQGNRFVFPLAGAIVTIRNGRNYCSACRAYDCDHIVAIISSAIPNDKDGISEFAKQLVGTKLRFNYATTKLIRHNSSVDQCIRCNYWYWEDDMSEEVDRVCMNCVR